MGFCRRCGEIVAGARCQCGGAAAAPVVPWNQSKPADTSQDKWSKIYVQRARSVSPTKPNTSAITQTSPAKRFPRPVASSSSTISNQVSAHIASSTSYSDRSHSPLKYSTSDSDIIPSLYDTTLSKVYGSVLQPKESLTTHSCALCSSPFPPDATIYPDPANPATNRFLCRPCYEANGGTKGICPSCSRPVLTLKSEGGFIHAAGQFWHKNCFNCSGCFKNIGDTPMIDLLGRPSCAECFENCLKRDPTTPKKNKSNSSNNSPMFEKTNNPGGMSSGYKDRKSREGSPAIEELEQRLGIAQSREASPVLEDLSQRLAALGRTNSPKYGNGSAAIRKYTGHGQDNPFTTRPTEGRNSRYKESTKVDSTGNSPATALRRPSARTSESGSHETTGSPVATPEAVDEMKQRFMKFAHSPTSNQCLTLASPVAPRVSPLRLSSSTSTPSSPKLKLASPEYDPSSPLSPSIPPTPDMLSDFSDTTTQSSLGPDSPPRNSDTFTSNHPYGYNCNSPRTWEFYDDVIAEETASQLGTPTRTPNSTRVGTISAKDMVTSSSPESPLRSKLAKESSSLSSDLSSNCCVSCGDSLFSVKGGGKYVTVPTDIGSPSATYHVGCFRCTKCGGVFSEAGSGQAVFVRAGGGACHVECAPPAKIVIHKTPSLGKLSVSPAPANSQAAPSPKPAILPSHKASSRLEQPPLTRPSTKSSPFTRFGGSLACPGCSKSVSPMEQGVVPGPAGTRWHASCLVCGGKKVAPKGISTWRSREEKKRSEPGCGKRLDSAAKTGAEGGVWCRDCLLLLGGGGSPQASPTRSPLVPSFTGITPQFTGTTTLARQFTGLSGGGDPGLLRQLTGGSVSPTRSISPTKQLGSGMRPRPKSVIGMRSTKSIDEGRGMFLVRQLTGAS